MPDVPVTDLTEEELAQAPKDAGVSSLSGSARRRREGSEQFARRIHAWMNTWTCMGPGCKRKRSEGTPWYFYCSDACRQASLASERKKRGIA